MTEYYIRVLGADVFNKVGGLRDLVHLDFSALDIDDSAGRTLDRRVEHSVINGFFNRFDSAVCAARSADTHNGIAALFEYCMYVRKIDVDTSGVGNKVGSRLNALTQYVVGVFERVLRGHVFCNARKFLVGNYYYGIDELAELGYAHLRVAHANIALELKRGRDKRNGQFAEVVRDFRDYGCRARARAAAHTRGNKYQVHVLDKVIKRFAALFRGEPALFGVCARAVTFGYVGANLHAFFSLGHAERLSVGVDSHELINVYACGYHVIHGIASAAAHADYNDLDGRSIGFVRSCGIAAVAYVFKSHVFNSLFLIVWRASDGTCRTVR